MKEGENLMEARRGVKRKAKWVLFGVEVAVILGMLVVVAHCLIHPYPCASYTQSQLCSGTQGA